MIVCPDCSEEFPHRTALCENRRNPKKCFGCPHCGKWLRKKSINIRQVAIVLGIVIFIYLNNYFIFVKELYTIHEINTVVLAALLIMLAYNFFRYGSFTNPNKKAQTKPSYYEVIPESNDV